MRWGRDHHEKGRRVPFDGGAVNLEPGGVLSWLLVGLLAGWLAGVITRARRFGCLGNVAIGLLGSALGGFLFSLLGVRGIEGFWGSVVVATVGAMLLLVLARLAGRPAR